MIGASDITPRVASRTRKTIRETSARIVGVATEFRICHIPGTVTDVSALANLLVKKYKVALLSCRNRMNLLIYCTV
jgi:hypothetical protein